MTVPNVSRGLRVLPPSQQNQNGVGGKTSVKREHIALQKDLDSIENWWNDPRWTHTKRSYKGV